MNTAILEKARKVKCLICDIDGVLTDALVYIDSHGNELKSFNIQDGFGLKLMMTAGIEIAVITGSNHYNIDHRIQQLGIQHYYKGRLNKEAAYADLKSNLKRDDEDFAYIGDDLPDFSIMKKVGFSIAVDNALPQIKSIADWKTTFRGGRGAVREACDFILTAQGKLEQSVHDYISNGQA